MVRKIKNASLMDAFLDAEDKNQVGRVVTKSNSLSDAIFNVLDTETTSAETADIYNKNGVLIIPKAKVIELAYARMSPNGNTSHFRDRFYDPCEPIPPGAMSVHNITDKMVKGKPKIEEEEDIVREEIGDYPILAYNSNFDFLMLPNLQDKKWLDVYKMAVHVWHIGQKNENGTPLTSFKQQELRFWLGLDDKYEITGEAHRADSDIQVTGFIFQEIKKHYLEVLNKPDTLKDFEEWVLSTPDYKTIPFGPMYVRRNPETGEYGVRPEDLTFNQLNNLVSSRNMMRESYDRFGVTEFVRKAYMEKLQARYAMKYDDNYQSVLSDISSFEQISDALTEEQKKQLDKHYVSREERIEKEQERLIEKMSNKEITFSEYIAKIAELNDDGYSWEDTGEDMSNMPKGVVKVNTPEYNVAAGVRATAKKTTARKQQTSSYMDKRFKR